MTPTQTQLQMMQHALGLDSHGLPPDGYRGCRDDDFPGCYRNRYVTDPASSAGIECEAMVALGWMRRNQRQPGFLMGGGGESKSAEMVCYSVKNEGFLMVKEHSLPRPKLSRSKARYQDYLNGGCALGSFKDYLNYLTHKRRHELSHL